MSRPEVTPQRLLDLLDAYLADLIDAPGLEELEERLRSSAAARDFFVRYCRMDTDLHLAIRARRAGERALRALGPGGVLKPAPARAARPWAPAALAAALLLAAGLIALVRRGADREPPPGARRPEDVAWLVNAQDCRWADGMAPAGDLQPGRILCIEQGLAEVGFRGGARIVLEGPARLELLSASAVRLLAGRASARVPEAARGFTVLSPGGKVVDLGTEFGLSVAEDGTTEVFVFEGRVEAVPLGAAESGQPAPAVTLGERQGALLGPGGVAPRPGEGVEDGLRFVRGIEPRTSIVPRTLRVDFRQAADGGILDASGAGTGLLERLPGTGTCLPAADPNLRLSCEEGQLELTTTNSDINTQFQLHHGEYLGVRLSDLGFRGSEDFAVTASIPNIPKLEFVGQFGLYAGAASDRVIRGGLISLEAADSYSHFLVNNDGGFDSDLYSVGLLTTGDDLRLTLRREGGRCSLTVENLTTGGSSTLAIRRPEYLDGAGDLFVGVFGANTQSEVQKTLIIKEFEVTVWTPSR